MGPSPPDLSPIGEGSADGGTLKRTCRLVGGGRLNLPLLGDKVAGPGVAPHTKPTRQGRPDPGKISNLTFELVILILPVMTV